MTDQWLVRKLLEQDKKIEALSRGGTGVGHTSIAPGEALTVISEDGEVVLGAGGVDYVDGPTPATPSAPTLKLGFGTIEVTWDGSFAAGEDENGIPLTAPVDLALVEIHASTDPDEEEWGGDTLKAQVKTKDGFTVTIGGFDVDDEVHVCLIAVSEVPKRSAPSATASLVIEGLDFSQLFNELDAANATIKNAGEILVTEQGTLGEKLAASDAALDALEVSLGELDETTLPALRNDLDAAEGRLDSAEGQITDAFGELALVPGQITDATQDALILAATDAQARADAAQAAADEAARAYAEAIATGIEPVDLDALRDHMATLAAQAKQAAIDAAALDATAKAETAEANAAVEAARVAQEKADQAKADAIADAAADASAKASAAQAAAGAIAQAAQVAADNALAEAESKASIEYILSRGTDLVTNGTGFTGDNTNFSPFTFEANDAPAGARGSFLTPSGQSLTLSGDEAMPVDSNRRYMLRASIRETNPNITLSRFYLGLNAVDVSGFPVGPANYAHKPEYIVTLTEDLNDGDTLVHVDDPDTLVAGFAQTSGNYLAAWNWTDAAGKTWPVGTYTRNVTANVHPVSREGAGVRISRAWSFGKVPAGTKVGVNFAGGAYMYVAATNQTAPQSWTTFYGATDSGVHDGSTGTAATRKFPAGTAGAKLLFLTNRNAAPAGQLSRQSFALVSFSDATLALNEAEAARAAAAAAQSTANTAQANAGTAQSAAVAAMDRANAVKGEAAADAQAKADAAAMAAESAAKAYALAQANGASADALAAAKADATDKADAARIAAEQAAAAHADSLPKVLHGTTVATGTAPDGSIWWQHQGTLSGPVVGQWNRVSGSWVSTPIRSEAIANLDAGKLTAGTATIAEAVVQKIAAQTASIQTADIKNLFVTGTASLSNVVAERIAAETAEFIELSVGNLVAGTGTMDEATITKLFADVVVAGMSIATEFIGENAILTGAVTAPKITASEELWAKIGEFVKIRAEQIQADAIDGMVVTGATFRTSGGSGSWSDAGLFIAQPNGTSMVRFPTDGSPLSLTASDVQIDRATITDLDLSNGSVRSGGQVTLASGVTAPASPPELTTGWQKLCSLENPGGNDYPPHAWGNLGYWGEGSGHWLRTVNIFGASSSVPDMLEILDYATGAYQRDFQIDLNPTGGVTVIGDVAYILGDVYAGDGSKTRWVHGFDLNTGARVSRWEFVRFPGGAGGRFATGTDGTNVVITGITPARTLYVFRYNPATGVQVGSDWSTPTGDWTGGQDLLGVHVNGSEVTILPSVTARIYTVSGNTLVRKLDAANANGFAGWNNPNKTGSGLAWVGSVPCVVDGQGDVYEGSTFTSDKTVQMCFTWTNGTHETTPSPVVTEQGLSREVITVSLPKRAGLSKRLYYRSGTSGSWVMRGVAEDATAYVVSDTGGVASSLPTTNTFPTATPATLKSTNNKFVVNGDGSGTWGPLTFNADGTMTSTQIPAWVPITSFASGFSAQTWGYVPSYRIWPDGKVEWRGTVAGTIDGTMDIFTIPLAARPAQAVNTVGASTSAAVSSLLKRVEFRPNKAQTMCRVYRGDADSTWVSLDNISYYKS